MATLRLLVLALLLVPSWAKGNEGLWLPIQLERLKGLDLQAAGLQLTPEEIYSINTSSLKDAIVSFNGYCSAGVISRSGLILTNHHCASKEIQQASRADNNLLEKGFWALKPSQEIAGEETYVRFLVRMEDVSDEVLNNLSPEITGDDREQKISEITKNIASAAEAGTHYQVEVKSFYHGMEFYLFIYERFDDVRLVGTPPNDIGRFGGETDNWEWPSHSADFALFRVYGGLDGKPASYSPDNIPLKSSFHLSLSLEGVEEGDFSMVMGYPEKTNRYTTASGVNYFMKHINPVKLALLQTKKRVLQEFIEIEPTAKTWLFYQLAEISNWEKYYLQQAITVADLQTAAIKSQEEQNFNRWLQKHPEKEQEFNGLVTSIDSAYQEMVELHRFNIYLVDGIFSSELLLFTYHFSGLYEPLAKKYPKQAYETKLTELKERSRSHFNNYRLQVDQKMTAAMMTKFFQSLPADQLPTVIRNLGKRYKEDFSGYCEELFKRSIFTDPEKVEKFLDNPRLKTLTKDPAYKLVRQLVAHYYGQVASPLKECYANLGQCYKIRLQSIRELKPEADLFPDANGTLRVSFGKVTKFSKLDGSAQPVQTWLSGLVTKNRSENPDYRVSEQLIDVFNSKDFDNYQENGDIPVAFLTDNDISGGSSGSPVLNGMGQVIGIVSDSNLEALAGEFYYHDRYQRSINIDIRYVLFIIEKLGQADNLLDELTLVGAVSELNPQEP